MSQCVIVTTKNSINKNEVVSDIKKCIVENFIPDCQDIEFDETNHDNQANLIVTSVGKITGSCFLSYSGESFNQFIICTYGMSCGFAGGGMTYEIAAYFAIKYDGEYVHENNIYDGPYIRWNKNKNKFENIYP
jgi:hypothetical protein